MGGQGSDKSLSRHRQPPSLFQPFFNIAQTLTPLFFFNCLFKFLSNSFLHSAGTASHLLSLNIAQAPTPLSFLQFSFNIQEAPPTCSKLSSRMPC